MKVDLYSILKSKQKWGGPGELERHCQEIARLKPDPLFATFSFQPGAVPFVNTLHSLDSESHQKIFGSRVIEEPQYTQALEAQVYIPATSQAHMTRLAEKATQDYLRHLESCLDLQSFKAVSVLDVGGGTGHLLLSIAHELKRRYPKIAFSYTLLEPSSAMCEEAKKNFSQHHYLFQLVPRMIEDPLNATLQVDWVLSHTMLHHLEHPLEACTVMKQMARHLLTIRDLSRPPQFLFQKVWQEQGQFYEGKMKELFGNSLMSSLSYPEFLSLAKHLGAEVETIAPMYQVLLHKK